MLVNIEEFLGGNSSKKQFLEIEIRSRRIHSSRKKNVHRKIKLVEIDSSRDLIPQIVIP